MQHLRFDFTATECQGWPRIRICIDGDVLLDHDFSSSQESVEIEYDVIDGDHTIEIERWGKQNFNMIHQDGEILKDQTVTLDDIWIQDVCLPEWFKSSGQFVWQQGVIPNGLTWGPNGVFSIPFQSPLIPWIVKQKFKDSTDQPGLYIPTDSNQQQVHQLLEKFQNDLNQVNV